MSAPLAGPEVPATPVTPTPDAPSSAAPETPPEAPPEAKPALTVEELQAELAKTRREAAASRVKVKELEPLAKKAQEADEALKSETQKALDRALAAEKAQSELQEGYTRMELAVHYKIEPEDIDLIGAGPRDEMEGRAKRIAAKNAAASKAAPPPTDRPVESLRPGATPEPPKPADDSYPAHWTPSYLRDKEGRSFHGQ